MKELMKVNYETEQPTVSARDLHIKLNIETPFNKWISRMCDYGFEAEKDFWTKKSESTGGRPSMEYELTVDMAKQICMIQRSPEGRELRQYFIDLEKAWNSPEMIMKRALEFVSQKVLELESQNSQQQLVIEEMAPKALFADSVAGSKTTILIGELAKIMRQNGINTGEKRLFRWMRENGYLIKRSGSDRNMPTQKSMEKNLFEIMERTVTKPDGCSEIKKTPKVTGIGQQYFIKKFLWEETYNA